MRVLLTDYAWPELDLERKILAEKGIELVVAPNGGEETLATLVAGCDGIMVNWAKVTARVLDAGPNVRIVSRLGIGLDNIDVAHCHGRGITVTNVPDYCLVEVAEHTLALVLSLARNIAWHHHLTKSGKYDLSSGAPMRRLEGRTLGLIGLGNIARIVAQKANGLGMRVVGTSRSQKPCPCVEVMAFDRVLAESDFVSLHLPLTAESRGILGREEFARMKPTAFLINTARGGLVDHTALAESLAQNRLAGAALDVQPVEPPDLSEPPFNDPRVIVTPHAAFVSVESLTELRTRVATQIATFLSGGTPENVIRPK